MCEICQYAKSIRKAVHSEMTRIYPTTKRDLNKDHLRLGALLLVNYFQSIIKGAMFSSFGQSTPQNFVGGCVFVNHMRGCLQVEQQQGK